MIREGQKVQPFDTCQANGNGHSTSSEPTEIHHISFGCKCAGGQANQNAGVPLMLDAQGNPIQ